MARPKSSGAPSSELEGLVLGEIWKRGSCTGYAIRKELLVSPTSHWSGSAGAIYPLLERLEKRGLVVSRAGNRGARAASAYALTDLGRRRCLEWLGPPLPEEVVAIASDPLRTRAHFLGLLPPRRRAAFLVAARRALERHLEDLRPIGRMDRYDHLALDAAVRITRARLRWLDSFDDRASGRRAGAQGQKTTRRPSLRLNPAPTEASR